MQIPQLSPRPCWVPWFLDPPEFEIATQVEEYRTLPWHRSFRKVSAVLIFFQAFALLFMTVAIPRASGPSGGLVAAAIYGILGIFVGLGSRGAMTAAMLLVTLNIASMVIGQLMNPLVWGVGLAWWLFFMERFWKASRVEQVRKLLLQSGAGSGTATS